MNISGIIKHLATGPDGVTYDPARVIGYGSVVIGFGVFIFNSLWSVISTNEFDAQSYGIGLGAVFAGIMAIGIGVGAKANTEPVPPSEGKP